jgi:hypothetical protein
MSVLTSYASAAARDSAAPAASNTGLCIFRSDTKAIEVSDGTNYLSYNNDGFAATYPTNTNSGEFDGINDYVDFGTIAELNSATNYSITAWLRWKDFDGGTGAFPIASGLSGSTSQRLAWYASSNTVKFYVGNTVTITSSSLSTDTWYHFAYVKNGTTATLYIDSSVDGTGTAAATTPTSGANNFAIGTATAFSGYYFDGYVDEVAVFDYALTNTQVSSIYSNKEYFNPLSVWRFENDVTDEIGNYDGTNNGVTFSTTVKPY